MRIADSLDFALVGKSVVVNIPPLSLPVVNILQIWTRTKRRVIVKTRAETRKQVHRYLGHWCDVTVTPTITHSDGWFFTYYDTLSQSNIKGSFHFGKPFPYLTFVLQIISDKCIFHICYDAKVLTPKKGHTNSDGCVTVE